MQVKATVVKCYSIHGVIFGKVKRKKGKHLVIVRTNRV